MVHDFTVGSVWRGAHGRLVRVVDLRQIGGRPEMLLAELGDPRKWPHRRPMWWFADARSSMAAELEPADTADA